MRIGHNENANVDLLSFKRKIVSLNDSVFLYVILEIELIGIS
jgi:hypothetical protein